MKSRESNSLWNCGLVIFQNHFKFQYDASIAILKPNISIFLPTTPGEETTINCWIICQFLAHLNQRLQGSLCYRQTPSSSVRSQFQFLLWNHLASCNHSYIAFRCRGNEKVVQTSLVTGPKTPPCLYMAKTLKVLLQNHLTDGLETWCVASGMPVVLPTLFKLWPCVDLDPFKAKFDHLGFCMGNSENYIFFETIAALSLKVGWSIQLDDFMKLNEYQRSRSFFDIGQRSLRFQS